MKAGRKPLLLQSIVPIRGRIVSELHLHRLALETSFGVWIVVAWIIIKGAAVTGWGSIARIARSLALALSICVVSVYVFYIVSFTLAIWIGAGVDKLRGRK